MAQSVRLSRAHDISQLISTTLNKGLIRWIVDLNFGTNVLAPKILRDFEVKDDVSLSMSDVATLVKDVGLRPTVEWISDRFNVDLEEEEFQVPTGPEGTAGVDTMNDDGVTLDGMDDEGVEDVDGDGEISELEETFDDVMGSDGKGEESEEESSGRLRNVMKTILG